MDRKETLTEEQIKNWRQVLLRELGSDALRISVGDIEEIRDSLQKFVNEYCDTDE
jgi:hypothetical protein